MNWLEFHRSKVLLARQNESLQIAYNIKVDSVKTPKKLTFMSIRRIAVPSALLFLAIGAIGACSSGDGNPTEARDDAIVPDNVPVVDSENPPPTPEPPAPEPPATEPPTPVPPAPEPPAVVEQAPREIILSPLPNPPLTPAPTAANEPIDESVQLHTVTEFIVKRDRAGAIDDVFDGRVTDAEFEAGPLEPTVQVPANVDPNQNAAPFFANLSDVTVFAGEELNLLLQPIDPDGGVAGMFPDAIPEGARYVDNFDTTRSLIWRPLQPDVGIREFTMTATDATEPLYRTRHTIRIRVLMPSDPSGIVNLPPVVNQVRPSTVRVDDPVAIHIKGVDPNGTVPTLEVVNPPAGSTFVQHPQDPQIRVLRFIPQTAGEIVLNVIARDSENPDSTGSNTITVDVRAASEFTRPGVPLRQLATQREVLIGFASLQDFHHRPDGAIYADIAGEEFDLLTTENSLKWDLVNPLPGDYRWASADNQVEYARSHQMAIHGHTLVWHRQIPNWVRTSAVEEREIHMREYIDRVLTRYRDDIKIWDVVNEALEDDDGRFRNSTWFEAMGEDFIEIAFRQARASAPDATLLYNEYDVSWKGPKSTAMINMLENLKTRNTPIDGVGFQMHLFTKFDRFDEVAETFQIIADMDLDIYITELDISMQSDDTAEDQAFVYQRVMSLCLDQPRCKAIQTWGYTDMYSWRRQYTPLLLDDAYQVKPAYLAVQQQLR